MSGHQNSENKRFNFKKWLDKQRNLPKNSIQKTLLVAFAVSLACGILVSTSTILLEPFQLAHMEQEQQRHLLEIVERQPGIKEIFKTVGVKQVEVKVIHLATGRYVQTINPNDFDPLKAARDPSQSVAIPPQLDIAKLQRRSKHALVYLVRQNGTIKFIILPIHGKGYNSTLYGYLGLDASGTTVIGLNFYQHKETPGLGANVSNRKWLDQWQGKRVRDPEGTLRIGVARGNVAVDSSAAVYEVDGISGATWTSQSVHNIVRFWLSDQGFGPYLRNLSSLESQ